VHVYTVGHSTRRQADLVDLLRRHEIATLADIRRFPGSRRNPQFNREQLAKALSVVGIRYVHLERLGGRRQVQNESSPNDGWRNAAFRAYADFMLTGEFEVGLKQLMSLAREGQLALMCAEATPWRCHRSLLSDRLTARGIAVSHILNPERVEPHNLTPFARVEGEQVTYPAEQPALQL
jgi:uncharacterized protein (DUF488 family)